MSTDEIFLQSWWVLELDASSVIWKCRTALVLLKLHPNQSLSIPIGNTKPTWLIATYITPPSSLTNILRDDYLLFPDTLFHYWIIVIIRHFLFYYSEHEQVSPPSWMSVPVSKMRDLDSNFYASKMNLVTIKTSPLFKENLLVQSLTPAQKFLSEHKKVSLIRL